VIDATLTKMEDIAEFMKYSVIDRLALVVDEKVEIKGRIPSLHKVLKKTKSNRGKQKVG